jgi:hypothetical protein
VFPSCIRPDASLEPVLFTSILLFGIKLSVSTARKTGGKEAKKRDKGV